MPNDLSFWTTVAILAVTLLIMLFVALLSKKLWVWVISKKAERWEVEVYVLYFFVTRSIIFTFFWYIALRLTIITNDRTAVAIGFIIAGIISWLREKQLKKKLFTAVAKTNPYLATKYLQ